MSNTYQYVQKMDVKYGNLELIDVPAIIAENKEKWFNQTLTTVNDSAVRLGIVQGEYHWHKHDVDDEFFFVLSGRLFIDLEGKTIELPPMTGTTIPKGVMHKTRAIEKTVMLMVETSSIDPLGNE
ncbi:MAG TPA: cupin domain-containing protein [Puia sp.]|nr:cupin domain-containing protein [Puia sp.]